MTTTPPYHRDFRLLQKELRTMVRRAVALAEPWRVYSAYWDSVVALSHSSYGRTDITTLQLWAARSVNRRLSRL